MTGIRRSVAAIVFVTIAVGLTGCTVPVRGFTALTLDGNDRVVAVVRMCSGGVDGVTAYGSSDSAETTLSSVSFPDRVTTESSLVLGDRSDLLSRMKDGYSYSAYGWSDDGSSSSDHISFSTQTLSALSHGDVYYLDWRRKNPDRVGTQSNFDGLPCSMLN